MNQQEKFLKDYLAQYEPMPEIVSILEDIQEYKAKEWYERKTTLLSQWDSSNAEEIVLSIFACILDQESMILQAMVGRLHHKIKIGSQIDKFEILADIIGICVNNGLLNLTHTQGDYLRVSTDFIINEKMPQQESHVTYFGRLQPVEGNRSEEYGDIILGCPMNRHNDFIRLDHINRVNQIQYSLNQRIVDGYLEVPKHELATQEQQKQWDKYVTESEEKYADILSNGNRYYIPNYVDYRGRTYALSYYHSPQGSAYKKAIIDLYNKEIMEGF